MLETLKRLYWDLADKRGRRAIYEYFIRDLPGSFGIMVRRNHYTKQFRSAGELLNVLPGSHIINPQNIVCGNSLSVGICNYLQAGGGITFGDNVMLGPYAKIWTQTHRFESTDVPIKTQGYEYKAVEIGDDVWIGANAFIMPGAQIGSHTIISACSVVSAKKYPEGIILSGYPARKIGER